MKILKVRTDKLGADGSQRRVVISYKLDGEQVFYKHRTCSEAEVREVRQQMFQELLDKQA